MTQAKPYVLSIAGFDPSAGAGVLADVKTFEANGAYGLGVVSALTWQNDIEFAKVEWLEVQKIIDQVALLLKRFEVRHIKIGLIESVAMLKEIVAYLHEAIQEPVIVYDPIHKASAGFDFGERNSVVDMARQLYCITPNIPEAERIFGTNDLAQTLLEYSIRTNVYLKGGHSDAGNSTDILFANGQQYTFQNVRLPKGEKHGSGCVLSSALTAQLALGSELTEAAERANRYTHQFLASNETLLGYHQPLAYEGYK